uniref:RdRp n=1 Tax=Hubei partiti-like virus 47 TaxID=1923055 RepID=A0A1L3KLF8_9VIRU|nr:RdRp [Hubei partiti-like virus 47]
MAWNAAVPFFPKTTWIRTTPRPWHIMSKLRAYHEKLPSSFDDARLQRAILATKRALKIPKVRPLHINDAIKQYQHPDRSPGLPYTTQGYRRKDEVDPNIIKQYIHNLKYNIYSKCKTPCNAIGKSMVGPKPKCRLVWCYPAHMTFAEGMFAMPLIRALIAKRGMYGGWIQYSKGDMRLLMSRRCRPLWLGADWDAFDSRVPAWLIRHAFNILKEYIDFDHYEEWGSPTHPETLPRLWNRIVHYFINTPYKQPDGVVSVKHQGVPSGSFFTSLIDSITQAIAVHYALDRAPRDMWVLGDDLLVSVDRSFNVEEFGDLIGKKFGFKLNLDKTEVGSHVSFLGYKMTPEGRPAARYHKLLAQLLLPSAPDQSLMDFVSRGRALQLSCFGLGCIEFTQQVQAFIDRLDIRVDYHLSKRDELRTKLENLGLGHWPPLIRVMQVV